MDKCICERIFETNNKLRGHKGKCKEWRSYKKKEIEKILTYEFLKKEFEIEKNSALSICKKLNHPDLLRVSTVISRANELGIKTPSVKQSANNKKTREKYKQTCRDKFGKENALSKGTKGYHKRNKTVKTKYGVDNVFQLEDVKEKIKTTSQLRYGVDNYVQSIEYEKYRNNGRRSKLQQLVEKELNKLGINFEYEVPTKFLKFNEELDRIYSPIVDILIEDKKTVIEVNGDVWHANPEKYNKDDVIVTWDGKQKASEIWKKDKIRKEQIESFGYKVIVIWQTDIKTDIKKVRKTLKKLKRDT